MAHYPSLQQVSSRSHGHAGVLAVEGGGGCHVSGKMGDLDVVSSCV